MDNARIAVNSARAADVDNHSGLLVLDPEVRRSRPDESERRGVVDGQHGLPLLVIHLAYMLSASET